MEPLNETDVIGRARNAMVDFQATQLLNATPYTVHTERLMRELGGLKPKTLAIMHGSSFGKPSRECSRQPTPFSYATGKSWCRRSRRPLPPDLTAAS